MRVMKALFTFCAAAFALSGAQAKPIVGAIRWDAWHGEQGGPGKAVQRSLGPKEWQSRLPFFAQVRGDDDVTIDGTPQDVMDKEIDYAANAGLDYWAFVTYPENDAMSLGIKRYLSSTKREKIKFCLVVESGRLRDEKFRQRVLSLMSETGYLKVLDNRPVCYLGFLSEANLKNQWGSVEEFRKVLDQMRAELKQKGAGEPYTVIMDFSPVQGKKWADTLGAQALSSYALNSGKSAAPYAELTSYAEKFWNACRGTGAQVVPIITAGWDRRPRIARPVPWETWQKPGENADKYYETPTPAELAAHTARALSWMQEYKTSTPTELALIYAWNENDEGGWLVPTRGESTARLDAISKVLK
jgi:hypothetical protein